MKKILLLTMHPFSSDNQAFFNKQIQGIMSVQSASAALVYLKDPIDSKFFHFGQSTKGSIEDYFIKFSHNLGNFSNEPDIDDLIVIETTTLNKSTNDTSNYVKNMIEVEANTESISMIYIDVPFNMALELSKPPRTKNFGIINSIENSKIGNYLEIYKVKGPIIEEIYNSGSISFCNKKAMACH